MDHEITHVEQAPPSPPQSAAERWAHLIQQASLCGRQLRRLLAQQIVRWNISDTEFLVLWACNHSQDKGLAQNELTSMLGVSAAQMSGLAYDLRDRSLITLERSERDRRLQVLRISGQGRLLLSRILTDLEPVVARLGQQFDESHQRAAEQLLEQLTQTAQHELIPPPAEPPRRDVLASIPPHPPQVRKAS